MMRATTIPLGEAGQTPYLEAYVLHNSREFQTDRRRPAVIVCPGGGYLSTSDREAEPIALRFLARGYHAFVLHYSVQTLFPRPLLDLATAVRYVRQHAAEWFVDEQQIVLCGFSAGGHLVASLGVHWDKPFVTEPLGVSPQQIKPTALVMGYPVIDLELVDDPPLADASEDEPLGLRAHILRTVFGSYPPPQESVDRYRLDQHVGPGTPPTFIWHTGEDTLVPVLNALRFAVALGEAKVPYELHVFEQGVHGLALADHTTEVGGQFVNVAAQVWIDLALRWLGRHVALG